MPEGARWPVRKKKVFISKYFFIQENMTVYRFPIENSTFAMQSFFTGAKKIHRRSNFHFPRLFSILVSTKLELNLRKHLPASLLPLLRSTQWQCWRHWTFFELFPFAGSGFCSRIWEMKPEKDPFLTLWRGINWGLLLAVKMQWKIIQISSPKGTDTITR